MQPSDNLARIEYGQAFDPAVMRLNTSHEDILGNIRSSVRRQLPAVMAHGENPDHIAIVGGGWSLDETFEELRDLYFRGVKLVALNGAAKWLMERNLRPSLHIVLDARPDNVEFLDVTVPQCRYLLASQCHPALFDMCEGRDTTLFHAVSPDSAEEVKILDEFYAKRWVRVPTAGTVGVTSIMLCRILGFRFQHLFGLDSCTREDGVHHAYPQALNEGEQVLAFESKIFNATGRKFHCSAWQAAQAHSFVDLIKVNGEHFQLTVHGDGLLAHILKTGAALDMEA